MTRWRSHFPVSNQGKCFSFFRSTPTRKWARVVGLAHAFEFTAVPANFYFRSYSLQPSGILQPSKRRRGGPAAFRPNPCTSAASLPHWTVSTSTTLRSTSSKTSSDEEESTSSSLSPSATDETRDRIISSSSLSNVENTQFSSTTTNPSLSSRISRRVRNVIGNVLTTSGFVISSTRALWGRSPRELWDPIQEPIVAFLEFLKTSGTDQELQRILQDRSSLLSLILLSRIHTQLSKEQESTSWEQTINDTDLPSLVDVQRYMRFSTAVYGQAMIRAAQIDARPSLSLTELATNWISNITALGAISEHIGIPTQDLVVVQINYDYSTAIATATEESPEDPHEDHYLRHLVAVDHRHKEVVLSLRGTFSLQEIVVDLVSFSRQNYVHTQGQAHEGMASMAERVWRAAGPTILRTLQEHPDYEFVVTGHSLGAGTACLLTIFLQNQQEQQQREKSQDTMSPEILLPPSTRLKCVAFAAPPVYSPIEDIPQATRLMTQVIHERDVVPFLSVYSVRHLMQSLEFLNQSIKSMSWRERVALATSLPAPPSELVDGIRSFQSSEPVEGAPRLRVPADRTIWLQETNGDESATTLDFHYQASVRPSMPWQISVHPNMFVDHFPPRYEYALGHTKDWKDND